MRGGDERFQARDECPRGAHPAHGGHSFCLNGRANVASARRPEQQVDDKGHSKGNGDSEEDSLARWIANHRCDGTEKEEADNPDDSPDFARMRAAHDDGLNIVQKKAPIRFEEAASEHEQHVIGSEPQARWAGPSKAASRKTFVFSFAQCCV